MLNKRLIAFSLVFGLAGCAYRTPAKEEPPRELVKENVFYDTQVTIGQCAPGAESAILTALAASAISKGVSRISEALKAAGEAETQTVLSGRSIEIAEGPADYCVTVARAWFYRDKPEYGPDVKMGSIFVKNIDSKWTQEYGSQINSFWNTGLFLAATPDFYFQGRIVSATDQSVYYIKPVFATLDKPLHTRTLRPSAQRSVVLALAIDKRSVDLAKSGGTTLILGALAPGKAGKFARLDCAAYIAGSESTPFCPEKNLEGLRLLIRSASMSEPFTLPISKKLSPLYISALVSETSDASKFMEFVGAIFSGASEKIITDLQNRLPAMSDALESKALSDNKTLENNADTTLANAYNKLTDCIAAPAVPSKRLEAKIAARDFVNASRLAERDTALTSSIIEAISAGGTTSNECEAARTLLIS